MPQLRLFQNKIKVIYNNLLKVIHNVLTGQIFTKPIKAYSMMPHQGRFIHNFTMPL
jgi:hypothetical protein